MDELDAEDVKTVATQVRSAIGDEFKWEWDGRFEGALTQFEKSNEPHILKALTHLFAHEWSVTNIDNAPESVLIAAESLGGLRSGQRLFSTRGDRDPLCLAAFWPWGNGTTISVRIIPFGFEISKAVMEQTVSRFREWMGL